MAIAMNNVTFGELTKPKNVYSVSISGDEGMKFLLTKAGKITFSNTQEETCVNTAKDGHLNVLN